MSTEPAFQRDRSRRSWCLFRASSPTSYLSACIRTLAGRTGICRHLSRFVQNGSTITQPAESGGMAQSSRRRSVSLRSSIHPAKLSELRPSCAISARRCSRGARSRTSMTASSTMQETHHRIQNSLHIKMPGEINGRRAARRILGELRSCIVLLTAYDSYREEARLIGGERLHCQTGSLSGVRPTGGRGV